MYIERLFLGFCVDSNLDQQLSVLDPQIRKTFLCGGDYLQEWSDGESKYLGKMIDSVADIPLLDLLESHILSLKLRLLPDPAAKPSAVSLLAVLQAESPGDANV